MYFAGIDENGLGAQIGPMVVTGIVSDVPHERMALLQSRSGAFPGVRDSKKIFSRRKLAFGETMALSIFRLIAGKAHTSFHALAADLTSDLQGITLLPCKIGGVKGLCLEHDLSIPLWCSPADVERITEGLSILLKQIGFGKGGFASMVWCPYRLNSLAALGDNKFGADLRSFLDLARAMRERVSGHLDVVAGRVGGRKFYHDHIRKGWQTTPRILKSNNRESAYRLGEELTLRFVVDADSSNVHVALASIVGKYLRELFMEALFRWCKERDPSLLRPSGYRDGISKAFTKKILPILRREGISEACFIRRK